MRTLYYLNPPIIVQTKQKLRALFVSFLLVKELHEIFSGFYFKVSDDLSFTLILLSQEIMLCKVITHLSLI